MSFTKTCLIQVVQSTLASGNNVCHSPRHVSSKWCGLLWPWEIMYVIHQDMSHLCALVLFDRRYFTNNVNILIKGRHVDVATA